jgi:HK97 family phage major capsid protein
MKTIQEQIAAFEATRAAKDAERNALMTKAAETGVTLDAKAAEQHDALTAEIEAIDAHLKRLRIQEASNIAAAKAVKAVDLKTGAEARTPATTVISVKSNLPAGIEFARMVMVKMHARLEGMNPVELAKVRYPDFPRIHEYLHKAAVPAATSVDPGWLGALVDPTNLSGEFVEFLRPKTIIGQFGQGGIPQLRRVPFNVRILGQTTKGSGYWVGQGKAKPLTRFNVAPTQLGWAKVANIAVLTEEIVRFSSPSAEALVRDELARAIIERMDIDFIDPAKAEVANVSPASITHGLVPIASSGSTADDIRMDFAKLIAQFIANNQDPSAIVVIMPASLALALSIQVNALGQKEFPGMSMTGGNLLGIPVIASQYAAFTTGGAGNIVIALNANEIFLADDGQVAVDMSREASLEMDDAPAATSGVPTPSQSVSMFQTNSIALRAERFINWARRRPEAVSYMDDVTWGPVGSPA